MPSKPMSTMHSARRFLPTLIVALLLMPHGVEAAYCSTSAHVAANAASFPPFTTGSINTTGTDTIVVAVVGTSGTTPVSGWVTDSKSNNYTVTTGASYQTAFSANIAFWSVATATVGSGHTFTFTPSSNWSFSAMAVLACNGGAASSPLDQQNGAQNNGIGTTLQPGSVTPSTDNQLVVTAVGSPAGGTIASVSAPYTITDTIAYSGGNNMGIAMAYAVQTTATATNPTWTDGSSGVGLIAGIVTFTASSAGGARGCKNGVALLGAGCHD